MFLNKNKQSVGFDAHIKLNRSIRTIGTVASVLLSVFLFLSAFPIAEPYDASAAIIPSATTLEVTSESNMIVLDLDVHDTTGTFNNSRSLNFSVSTDNITGYTLSLGSGNQSGKLINTRISTASLNTIPSILNYMSDAPNGTWWIQPSKYNSSYANNYYPAPTTDSIILDTTSGPNSTPETYDIGIGAKADYSTPAGTYSGTLILQATGRPVLYEINYLDNTDDESIENIPVQEASGVTPVASFTLSDEVPTRTGYEFVGWCDGEVDHTANPSTCTGTTYNPGDTYTFSGISSESTNIANLYAMWHTDGYVITFNTVNAESITFDGVTYTNGQTATVAEGTYSLVGNYATRYAFSSWNATAGTISNADYVDYNLNTYTVAGNATITLTGQYVETELQGLATSSCTTTPMPTYDNRDGQVYWVKRLGDGNCWMMDNMNLGAVDLTTDLTSFNTNIGGTVSAATFNGWKKATGSASYTSAEFIPLTPENTRNYRLLSTGNGNTYTDEQEYMGTDIHDVSGNKFGTLYNYCAASAGTYCVGNNVNIGDAVADICPAGWRMAKNDEFSALMSSLTHRELLESPVSEEGGAAFTLSGTFSDGAPTGQGFYSRRYMGAAYYWTSTRYDESKMYQLWMVDQPYTFYAAAGFTSGPARNQGGPLRCIRDTSMQGFSDADAAAMAEGATATLTDRRDGNTYNVAKINGNVWMTQNLRFTQNILNPVDTNVSSPRVVSYSNMNSADCSSDEVTGPTMSALCLEVGTDSNGDPTVWYNFAAASGGSITGQKNLNEAVDSVCPKGWRLPTNAEHLGIANNDTYKALYNPVGGGEHIGTVELLPAVGLWWSSTQYNEYNRYWLAYSNTSDTLTATGRVYRFSSIFVRCIKGDRTINEVSYMQDVDEKIKQATPKGTSVTLTDRRDGEQYLVAKLEDNNIYMLDNLRLDPTTVDLDKLQGDTNAPDEALNYLKNGGGTLPYATAAISASFESTQDAPYIATGSKDTVASKTYGSGSGKIGVHYNYCAITAGTDCGNSTSDGSGGTDYDLCPAGWRLPVITYGGWSDPNIVNNEIHTLYLAYNSDHVAFKEAMSTPLSGYVNGSSMDIYDNGSTGRFWAKGNLYWRVDNYSISDTYGAAGGYAYSARCRVK